MSEDFGSFITSYQRARATREPAQRAEAFAEIWTADGRLVHPTLSEPISGDLLPAFDAHVHATLPDLHWRLLGWAGLGNTVFLEWSCTATVGSAELEWRGVDRMALENGRIVEEVVYSDTMPLWRALDPTTMPTGALVDAAQLT